MNTVVQEEEGDGGVSSPSSPSSSSSTSPSSSSSLPLPHAPSPTLYSRHREKILEYAERSSIRLPFESRLEPCLLRIAGRQWPLSTAFVCFMDCVTMKAREGTSEELPLTHLTTRDEFGRRADVVRRSYLREKEKADLRRRQYTISGREMVTQAHCSTMSNRSEERRVGKECRS